MNLLMEAMRGLGAVLLQVVAALLLEELTFGGLVRLFIAPRPETGIRRTPGERARSLRRKIRELKHKRGEGKCSH
jgi:hypothetical protein